MTNSTMNITPAKKGVTHEKWPIDPKNPRLMRFWESNAHYLA